MFDRKHPTDTEDISSEKEGTGDATLLDDTAGTPAQTEQKKNGSSEYNLEQWFITLMLMCVVLSIALNCAGTLTIHSKRKLILDVASMAFSCHTQEASPLLGTIKQPFL